MAKKNKYTYDWPRPMVTVDAVVFTFIQNKPQILLINRKNEPFKNCWAIPGGFVELDEELCDAAARELKEETSISNVNLKQLHTFAAVGRDPRGRQITIVFWGITKNPQQIKAGDDAQDAKWFPLDTLPKNLAFDHEKILKLAIKKLNKP